MTQHSLREGLIELFSLERRKGVSFILEMAHSPSPSRPHSRYTTDACSRLKSSSFFYVHNNLDVPHDEQWAGLVQALWTKKKGNRIWGMVLLPPCCIALLLVLRSVGGTGAEKWMKDENTGWKDRNEWEHMETIHAACVWASHACWDPHVYSDSHKICLLDHTRTRAWGPKRELSNYL